MAAPSSSLSGPVLSPEPASVSSNPPPILTESDVKILRDALPDAIVDLVVQLQLQSIERLPPRASVVQNPKMLEVCYKVPPFEHTITLTVFCDGHALVKVHQIRPKSPTGRDVLETRFAIRWEKSHCVHTAYQNWCVDGASLPTDIVDAVYIDCFKQQITNIDNADLNYTHFLKDAVLKQTLLKLDPSLVDV